MKTAVLFALVTLSLQPAFAGQSLSFDQLKEACQNPAKYHSQIQPTGIKVDCADRQITWSQAADEAFALPAERSIGFSISSDKYTVPMTHGSLQVPALSSACPVFNQVEETIAVSQSFTCEQLIAFQGTAANLCTKLVDQMRNDNPQAIVRKETGKQVHLCQTPDDTDDRGQRGQRGQR